MDNLFSDELLDIKKADYVSVEGEEGPQIPIIHQNGETALGGGDLVPVKPALPVLAQTEQVSPKSPDALSLESNLTPQEITNARHFLKTIGSLTPDQLTDAVNLFKVINSGEVSSNASLGDIRAAAEALGEREHARNALEALSMMEEVSHRNAHALALKLKEVGNTLQLKSSATILKLAVSAGILALGSLTVYEGIRTLGTLPQLVGGAEQFVKSLPLDLHGMNSAKDTIGAALPQLFDHGVKTIEGIIGTGVSIWVDPIKRIDQITHGSGKALRFAGTVLTKSLGTEDTIQTAKKRHSDKK